MSDLSDFVAPCSLQMNCDLEILRGAIHYCSYGMAACKKYNEGKEKVEPPVLDEDTKNKILISAYHTIMRDE